MRLAWVMFLTLLGCEKSSSTMQPQVSVSGEELKLQTEWQTELAATGPEIIGQHQIPQVDGEIIQFRSVFWEPDDTESMREYLVSEVKLRDAKILEIGTGTGLIALVCLTQGASSVVATDINPAAILNAQYNAEQLGLKGLQTRLVSAQDPSAFSVVQAGEKFDYVISNPPWEDANVTEPAAYALYDPEFRLVDSLIEQADSYLRPGGKLLLAYGAREAIERIQILGRDQGWEVKILDSRSLDDVPEVFLPGMLLELTKPN